MNESFYKAVVDNSPFAFAYYKIVYNIARKPCDFVLLKANCAFERMLGYEADKVIGKKVSKIFPDIKKDSIDWIKIYNDVSQNSTNTTLETFSDRLQKHFRVNVYSPQEKYIITIFEDITEAKAEKVKAENRFKVLFDNMKSAAIIYEVRNGGFSGKDYIIKALNKKSARMEGMKKEEIINRSISEIRPNVDEFGIISSFREVWKSGNPKHLPPREYKDEKFCNWYENDIYRLESNIIVAIYTDVTDMMKKQKALSKSRDKLKSYIDKAPYTVLDD